jgi:cytochrome oxidase assembly protein ShyY1
LSDVLAVLKKPAWWGLLLALPFAMALCMVAADWQWDRYERRSAEQARADAVESTTPVPLPGALPPGQDLPASALFQPVTASGVYDPQTVLIRNRSLDEERGQWVVSPLRLTDGSVVMVLRGWQAATRETAQEPAVPPPPAGAVTVTGVLQAPEPKRGPGILSNGEATSLNTATLCPDPACYRPYLHLMSSQPQDTVTAVPVRGPGLGPHQGYAGQWVIFALLLPVGYVILLRREIRETRAARDPLTVSG